jgi:GTP-binding protein LepA
MDPLHIRNFCIIAHIDHGKSTLADRLLEATGTVQAREMTEQFLDQMELERERGITIKAQAVRMRYVTRLGKEYQFNLIDTPGHVDFSYEVSRSLAACEGAILVVDASQGIQAQTLAHTYMALGHDLALIPVVNKVDLPMAEPLRIAEEVQRVFGFSHNEIILASAKDGTGTEEILQTIVDRIPAPKGNTEGPLRALIFDSSYDSYKGVLAYVRVFDGALAQGEKITLMSTSTTTEVLEVGVFRPRLGSVGRLHAGEVGYVATGLKDVRECRVGDTITVAQNPASEPLPGYTPLKPMVFAGLYPIQGQEYPALRAALERLQLNDASLSFEPESSTALGFGFRCGFLGLLHMDIVQERLEREYGLALIITAPSVAYQVILTDGTTREVDNPAMLPSAQQIEELMEPWIEVSIITPARFIGRIMELLNSRRGAYRRTEYMKGGENDSPTPASDARVLLEYEMPLGEMLWDFHNQLKARTQGYASLDYNHIGYRASPLVRLDILVNNKPVDALSFIIHKDRVQQQGKAMAARLRELIPRQLFEVAVQAALGSRIIARETIRPLRKNVLAKCYGGDVTRKRKLLEKQAEGKKRLKKVGAVEIPQEAFLALLKAGEE